MGEPIAEALPFAVGIAASPVPIIGVLLMLGTRRARSTGPAFALGWLFGLIAVGVIVLLLTNGARSEGGEPSAWAGAFKLTLGTVFLVLALRQWRGRPRAGETPPMPRWIQTVDAFTPGRARVFGVGFAAANPKNILLAVGAAAAIARAEASAPAQALALAVFIAVGTLGVGVPVLVYFALGERSARFLAALRAWMSAHNATVTGLILLVIAVKLISDAIRGFA
jgi:threonine/homoserine/homoserine lactone efflux protein